MKSLRARPPDRGRSCVVALSAFFVTGLSTGVLKNFGIFFTDIQNHFGVPTSTTSWVMSTTIATFHLGAPAASVLILQYSQRVVAIIGGLLATSGMVLASLDLSLPWLYLSMGVLQGVGISFSWISASSMVSHHFVQWRPIAYAIASAGESVFAVVFSPFFHWLIETYSWQGSLLIIGGLQLNMCVCGALMRPLETAQSAAQETKDVVESGTVVLPPRRKDIFQFSLLRVPELSLYVLFGVFAAAGFFIPPLFLVPFASSLGVAKYWPAFILSVVAFTDLAGRLVCGWVANTRLIRNMQLLTIVVTLKGVVLLLLPIYHNYWSILVFATLYGFLLGCVVAIHVTSIIDIVSLERFDHGMGLFMLFRSIGGFIGPPAAGWLVDKTGGYSSPFYFSGLCLVASGAFVAVADYLVQRRAVQVEGRRVVGQEDREE